MGELVLKQSVRAHGPLVVRVIYNVRIIVRILLDYVTPVGIFL